MLFKPFSGAIIVRFSPFLFGISNDLYKGFPYKKYLLDLERKYLPEDAQNKLNVLETLEFIKNGQNVILAGNPGTGKTHMAIGLGIQACKEGYKVLFTSAPTLINKLKESKSNRTLTNI